MNGSFVVSVLADVTLVTAGSLVAVRLARKSRAATRHVWLASTFVTLLMLPAVAVISPRLELPVPTLAGSNVIAPAVELITDAVSTTPSVSTPQTGAPGGTRASETSFWLTLLLAGWLIGTCVCLAPIVVATCHIRPLRRSGIHWPDADTLVRQLAVGHQWRSRVDVLLHADVSGPMTCGTMHPIIVLPMDAEHWPLDALERSLVHELEHVRRRDWASHCLARMICAVYWFHPLVWIAQRRLTLEAERACDDAVVLRSEATGYAFQLVDLARRLSSVQRPSVLEMASRRDLATRIRALLDGGQARGRAGAVGAILAWLVAAVLLLTISPLRIVNAPLLLAESQALGPRPHYDVATIKRCDDDAPPRPALGTAGGGARGSVDGINAAFSPGRVYVPCATTEQLIYLAYGGSGAPVDQRLVNDDLGSGSNTTKVRGGPAWVHSPREKYSLEATAEGVTERAALMGTMLQTLLEDRFKLRLHRETEDVPMRKLVAAKGGLTIKPMKDGDCTPHGQDGPASLDTTKPTCGAFTIDARDGLVVWSFGGFELNVVTDWLGHVVGAHVIDATGLTGKYIIRLQFVPDRDTSASPRGEITSTPAAGPDLFTALQEQLGLKLEVTRGPRGYLVVDTIERPTPDAPIAAPLARAAGAGPRRF